ncbi:MAG: hypothetical protein KatS3mg104_1337 [Phycisphaerae bacterium]|nr:MAG: hypothetical protein KatS3mg104_1337 [Phycisphaerae bacterium]
MGRGFGLMLPEGNNRIEDNLVVRNTVGISIEISRPSPGDTYTALIQNNRIAFNRHQGIYVSASSQVRVIRNTLFQNRWDMVLHGMPRQEGSLSGNEVKDNLLLGNNADLIVYAGPEAHANQINGNIYARGQGKAKIGVVDHPGYDVSFSDLRALQKAYPDFEKQGQSLSVRFRDPDRLDFRVIGDSMVRGKGWVQSSVSGTGSQHP